MQKYEYLYKVVREKKTYAREVIGLPKYENVKPKDRPEWQKKHILYLETCEQIIICEQLVCPLSKEMIKELCEMENLNQIRRYCHNVKTA